jgi:hypothetical protein
MAQLLRNDVVSTLEGGDVVSVEFLEKVADVLVPMYPRCENRIVLFGEPYSCEDTYLAFKHLVSATESRYVEYLGIRSLESVL